MSFDEMYDEMLTTSSAPRGAAVHAASHAAGPDARRPPSGTEGPSVRASRYRTAAMVGGRRPRLRRGRRLPGRPRRLLHRQPGGRPRRRVLDTPGPPAGRRGQPGLPRRRPAARRPPAAASSRRFGLAHPGHHAVPDALDRRAGGPAPSPRSRSAPRGRRAALGSAARWHRLDGHRGTGDRGGTGRRARAAPQASDLGLSASSTT